MAEIKKKVKAKKEAEVKAAKKVAKKVVEKKVEKKEKTKLSAWERKYSKKYRAVSALLERGKTYSIEEAIDLVKKTSTTKFDSSVEIHVRLGIDPSASDQQLRSTVVLPAGTGSVVRVAVVCPPEKEKEATEAKADRVGSDALISEIEKGKIDFDVLVSTPDMMAKLGKLGKILGTKGLMPNPKAGTVTTDVGRTVKELKSGRVEFKNDKNGIVHQVIGKVSFEDSKLLDNYNAFMEVLKKVKPTGIKGTYVKSVFVATTMGPGIKIAQ